MQHSTAGIMDQFAYAKVLEEIMLPYAEEDMPLKWKLTPNTSKILVPTNKITVMAWPAESLELNPIEKLQHGLKNAVFEAKLRDANELWSVVKRILE